MSSTTRGLTAIAISALLAWGGVTMMRRGVYGLALFMVLPAVMGGLAASTLTPGSTAPLVSRTTPENALCADAVVGRRARRERTSNSSGGIRRSMVTSQAL